MPSARRAAILLFKVELIYPNACVNQVLLPSCQLLIVSDLSGSYCAASINWDLIGSFSIVLSLPQLIGGDKSFGPSIGRFAAFFWVVPVTALSAFRLHERIPDLLQLATVAFWRQRRSLSCLSRSPAS